MHCPSHNIWSGERILEIHEIAFDQAKRIINQGFQIFPRRDLTGILHKLFMGW